MLSIIALFIIEFIDDSPSSRVFWATYRESPFVNKPAASNFNLYLSAMCKKKHVVNHCLVRHWVHWRFFFSKRFFELPTGNLHSSTNLQPLTLTYIFLPCARKHQAICEYLQGKWLTISCVIPRLLSTFQSLTNKHLCALFWSLSNFIFMEHFKVIIFGKKCIKIAS